MKALFRDYIFLCIVAILPYPEHMLSPKYNKNNIPFRIIVPSINTVLYPIAFFFHSIIVSGMKKNSRQARNCFKIYKTLTGTRINDSVMISLDDFYVHKHFSRSCNKQHNEWHLISQKTNIPFNTFIEALKFFFFLFCQRFFLSIKKFINKCSVHRWDFLCLPSLPN